MCIRDSSYCEVGTASAVDDQGEAFLAGTPYFGATGQETDIEYDPDGAEVANNVYTEMCIRDRLSAHRYGA